MDRTSAILFAGRVPSSEALSEDMVQSFFSFLGKQQVVFFCMFDQQADEGDVLGYCRRLRINHMSKTSLFPARISSDPQPLRQELNLVHLDFWCCANW